MKRWVYDPQSGGKKISLEHQEEICEQAEAFSKMRPWYSRTRLNLRFKNQFCYIDTLDLTDKKTLPLCRLRNLSRGWSLALFTYSNERYQPCIFPDGNWEGSLEAAIELCEPFIF